MKEAKQFVSTPKGGRPEDAELEEKWNVSLVRTLS